MNNQIQNVLAGLINQYGVPFVTAFVNQKIGEINNERTRQGLTLLSAPFLEAADFLTDEDPDNAAQAEAVLDAWLRNPKVQEFLLTELLVPLIEQTVQNAMLRALIVQTLIQGIETGAEELAQVDVFDKSEEEVVPAAFNRTNVLRHLGAEHVRLSKAAA